MSEIETAKKRGRPAKFAGGRTRGSLTVRLRDEVRSELERSAAKYGRSLSEEIEARMEISLASKHQIRYEWGEDLYSIASSLASSLSYIENQTGINWIDDKKTQELFELTAVQIIRNYKSLAERDGQVVPTGDFDSKTSEDLAKMFAAAGGMPPARPKRERVNLVIHEEE